MNPCPFCKSDKVIPTMGYTSGRYYERYYYGYCENCKARGPASSSEEKSITSWNEYNISPEDVIKNIENFTEMADSVTKKYADLGLIT